MKPETVENLKLLTDSLYTISQVARKLSNNSDLTSFDQKKFMKMHNKFWNKWFWVSAIFRDPLYVNGGRDPRQLEFDFDSMTPVKREN